MMFRVDDGGGGYWNTGCDTPELNAGNSAKWENATLRRGVVHSENVLRFEVSGFCSGPRNNFFFRETPPKAPVYDRRGRYRTWSNRLVPHDGMTSSLATTTIKM